MSLQNLHGELLTPNVMALGRYLGHEGGALVPGFSALIKEPPTPTPNFPGGSVKNPPANAGDIGSIPGTGRSHVTWSS